MKLLKQNSLLRSLAELRGNPRACVYTEPMWGLSMNLCLPYASVYMLGLGMNDVEVGIISSIYMFSQTVFSILSGISSQIPLERFFEIGYNEQVYPQFSRGVMKPLGQMRGNDYHECIQQEKAP